MVQDLTRQHLDVEDRLTNLVHDPEQFLPLSVMPPNLILNPSTPRSLRVSSIQHLDDDIASLDDLSQFTHKGFG